MKMIFKIAKNELRNLFYSPVAWFLAIAFLVQCAVFYTNALYPLSKWQDILLKNTPGFKDFGDFALTSTLFLNPDGIFSNVLENLYLFVPLLCMGLINREINSGTIKLLYSSPVKMRDIVLGKYLAIMIYNLLLVLIVGIFIVTGLINIRHADLGLLLSASLGFYLLVCAYTAIGLFMSSLTTYQIVAAIGSFITIFVLSRIGGLWQKIDFVRDLTYFLSISGRTVKMVKGLITSKDVLYFVLIMYMFLAFTWLRLKGSRESKPWYVKTMGYLAVIASTLVIGYLSSRPAFTLYLDATATHSNTIHPNTQKILKEMGKDELEVTLYANMLGAGINNGLPEARNTYLSTLWEPYLRFKPDIRFRYVYYYDNDPSMDDSAYHKMFPNKTLKEVAELMAEGQEARFSRFVGPEVVRKEVDLKPEKYRLVMQLKYKGRSVFLRTFDDAIFWPNEQQVAPAFKRLLQDNVPKILYVTGDLERSIYKKGEREYYSHSIDKGSRSALINSGFDADSIDLNTQEIPTGITALVLADPKTDLSASSQEKIRHYIDKGGNMMILGEPGKQYVLNPLLKQLGVQLMDGIIVEPTSDEMPHMAKPYLTLTAADLAEEGPLTHLKETGDTIKWLMPGVSGIAYEQHGPFLIQPLMMTIGSRSWLKAGKLVTDSVPPVFSPQEGDIRGSFPTAIALTRQIAGKEQKIIVCGDADYISSVRMGGGFVSRAMFSWLDDNQFPVYTPGPTAKDNKLRITATGAGIMKIIYVWVLPGLVLLMATILLIRRKRK